MEADQQVWGMLAMEEKKFVGEWWIPGKARRKVKGTLYISLTGESRLELIGLFEDEDITSFFNASDNNPKIIFGDAGGKIFSLYQNETSDKAIGLKVPHVTFTPGLILEGLHRKDLSENKFTSLIFNYTHLEDWCAEKTFFGDVVISDEGKALRVNVTGVPFTSDPIQLPSLKSVLIISHRIEHQHQKFKKVELTDTVTMKLTPESTQSFEWFETALEKFQIMLALFTGRAVYPERCVLEGIQNSKSKKAGSFSSGSGSQIRVQVYYRKKRNASKDESDDRQVIVPFNSIKNNASEIINNYLEKYDDLEQVFQLIIASAYQPDFLAQSRFLNLMQAVETFHRRIGGRKGKYLSESLHERLKAELEADYNLIFKKLSDELSTPAGAAAYPDDKVSVLIKLNQLLVKRLENSNEISLRSRMELIFKELSKTETKLITDKAGSFVHHSTSTRDYLTHYDKSRKNTALKGLKLFQTTVGLEILLLLLIMRELGIDEDSRIRLIRGNGRLNFRNFRTVDFK